MTKTFSKRSGEASIKFDPDIRIHVKTKAASMCCLLTSKKLTFDVCELSSLTTKRSVKERGKLMIVEFRCYHHFRMRNGEYLEMSSGFWR